MKTPRIIFITGAARSGTNLLASILRENIHNHHYMSEVNSLWTQHVPGETDMVTTHQTETLDLVKIRELILSKLPNESIDFLIEKTAANTLRLPLLHRCFPEAKILYILRDGRDVASSVRRKMNGDTRKTTNLDPEFLNRQKTTDKLRNFRDLVSEKIQHGISFRSFWRDFDKYIHLAAAHIFNKKTGAVIWGPVCPGLKECRKNLSPLELAGLQWKISVNTALNYIVSVNQPATFACIRYEDLLESPDILIEKIFDFLEIDVQSPRHSIRTSGMGWNDVLNDTEKAELSRGLEFELRQLGYKETFTDSASNEPILMCTAPFFLES